MEFKKAPYATTFCEFMSVFFIVLALNITANIPATRINMFAVPFTVMLVLYLTANISQGLFNGIILLLDFLVTYSSKKPYDIRKPIVFTIAHLAGAYTAMTIVYFCFPTLAVGPIATVPLWKAGLYEGFYAFILCLVALVAWDQHSIPVNSIYIGLCFTFIISNGIITIGEYTGACLNPTLWIAIKSYRFYVYGGLDEFSQILPYFIGEFSGSILAFLCYKYFIQRGLKEIHYKNHNTVSITCKTKNETLVISSEDRLLLKDSNKYIKLITE